MSQNFLIYGANGFVGREIARLAVQQGLRAVLAGRNAAQVAALAAKLDLEHRVFGLDDPPAIDIGLQDAGVVLHCAGPFINTYQAMSEACLRQGAHYLDLTGEIPVYAALAARDEEARARQVMLMPGVGFDVVPTDCLAAHLKRRMPNAMYLAMAFQSTGPTRMPPGTARTGLTNLPKATLVRRDGRLQNAPQEAKTRWVDFGRGQRQVILLSWGDVFTAYYTTGIPNIESYLALRPGLIRLRRMADRLRPVMKFSLARRIVAPLIPTGSTPEQRLQSRTHVWGEVTDDQGRTAVSRLHGPEAGVDWTALAALGVVKKILEGQFQPGYQTPARVYGPDFVLEADGVTREDLD